MQAQGWKESCLAAGEWIKNSVRTGSHLPACLPRCSPQGQRRTVEVEGRLPPHSANGPSEAGFQGIHTEGCSTEDLSTGDAQESPSVNGPSGAGSERIDMEGFSTEDLSTGDAQESQEGVPLPPPLAPPVPAVSTTEATIGPEQFFIGEIGKKTFGKSHNRNSGQRYSVQLWHGGNT